MEIISSSASSFIVHWAWNRGVMKPQILKNTFLFSVATIAVPTIDVYTVDPHKISCVLSKITGQSTITWNTQTNIGKMSIEQGTFGSNSQSSILTLSEKQLKSLANTGTRDHVFTCNYKIKGVEITAKQTTSVYDPGT